MKESEKSPKTKFALARAGKWREEFEKLRAIILELPLVEQVKWGWPCYSFQDGNIVLIHGFKEYCALLFFKGALLNDPKGILVQQTENVQSARQIRFTNARQVVEMEAVLKAYIQEAIDAQKAGLKVTLKKTAEFEIPEELQARLNANPALKTAFYGLTPGRQRGYVLHFSSPKQSRTREARIEKCAPQILEGKGLND
jgi:uncharacterized protein YdeI (YjbR/CyaY-like superfamily)